MRCINLLAMSVQHFRSFVRQEIDFSSEPGFKYLTGENLEAPRLGANGAGKSSLLDAIFWCWYGVSVRGQRAADLATWGHKQPMVATKLIVDGHHHIIARSGSPDRLSIDGEPASQASVDQLLGLSRLRAMNALIFGQNAPVFADLSVAARGAILDEVMDLQVWLDSADEAKRAADEHSKEAAALELSLARMEGKLEGLPDLGELEEASAAWEAQRGERLAKAEKRLAQEDAKFGELDAKVELAKEAAGDQQALKDAREEVTAATAKQTRLRNRISVLKSNLAEAEHRLDHWQSNPTCERCKQILPAARRKQELASGEVERAALDKELGEARASLLKVASEALAAEDAYEALLRKHGGAEEAVKAARDARKAQRELCRDIADTVAALVEQKNPHRAAIAKAKAQRKELQAEKRKQGARRLEVLGQVEQAQFWQAAFKRVRLFEISRVLAHLDLEIEAAANRLGLAGWRIKTATETETKSGTLKHGVQIVISNAQGTAPWESWSGGESQRLRLAIAIGFATMIQRMSGVRYGVEFWDEPSAWLSEEGIEDLLATLRDRSEREALSLWLVDHRALQSVAFDEVWSVRKSDKGSELVRK